MHRLRTVLTVAVLMLGVLALPALARTIEGDDGHDTLNGHTAARRAARQRLER